MQKKFNLTPKISPKELVKRMHQLHDMPINSPSKHQNSISTDRVEAFINSFRPNNAKSSQLHPEITLALVKGGLDGYISPRATYIAYYNLVPNIIEIDEINCRKSVDWFINKYKGEITDIHYNKAFKDENMKPVYEQLLILSHESILVNYDYERERVYLLFHQTSIAAIESIVKGMKKWKIKQPEENPEISLVVTTSHGIDTKSLEIPRVKLVIRENYNTDFEIFHKTILKKLKRKNSKGLVLLHGKPGTGKTTYIRHLIHKLRKNVIFLPPNIACSITNPDLISLLIDNPNSILVIEDAENLVSSRDLNGHSPVSAILNISDGLLSDSLNIQIICSFNTDISKIDRALMRKGRLIAMYEFKELDILKTKNLSRKLGFSMAPDKPMILADIYNQEEPDILHYENKARIGFRLPDNVN